MSEPEPNSLSLSALIPLVSFFNLPMSPAFFLLLLFSPRTHSLCVDRLDSLDPVDSLSTEVSRSSRRILNVLYASVLEYRDLHNPLTGVWQNDLMRKQFGE